MTCNCLPNAGILWKNCYSAIFIRLAMQSQFCTSDSSGNYGNRKSQNFSIKFYLLLREMNPENVQEKCKKSPFPEGKPETKVLKDCSIACSYCVPGGAINWSSAMPLNISPNRPCKPTDHQCCRLPVSEFWGPQQISFSSMATNGKLAQMRHISTNDFPPPLQPSAHIM